MTQQVINPHAHDSRRGVRRTVWILALLVAFFFALSFLQILLMK